MDDVLVIGFADPLAEDAGSIRRTAGDSLDRLEGILREIAAEDAAVVRGEDIDQIGLAPEGDELRFEPGAAFAQRFLGIEMRADAAQMAADDLQYFGSDVINGVVRIVKADESDDFPAAKIGSTAMLWMPCACRMSYSAGIASLIVSRSQRLMAFPPRSM